MKERVTYRDPSYVYLKKNLFEDCWPATELSCQEVQEGKKLNQRNYMLCITCKYILQIDSNGNWNYCIQISNTVYVFITICSIENIDLIIVWKYNFLILLNQIVIHICYKFKHFYSSIMSNHRFHELYKQVLRWELWKWNLTLWETDQLTDRQTGFIGKFHFQ